MKISRRVKMLIGVVTAWVVLDPFALLSVALMLSFSALGSYTNTRNAFLLLGIPSCAMLLNCLSILIRFALDAFYLIHIVKNTTASYITRIFAAFGIFIIPFIVLPLYYYLYIWLDQPPAWAQRFDSLLR